MKKLSLLILSVFCVCFSYGQNNCELTVRVGNIESIKGSLKIAIYDHEDRFLSKEIISDGKSIIENEMHFTFKGLSKGIYAVSIYQDENDNGKLDANFMGIPSEPYAFSNNAKGMFGPPSFEECQFEILGDSQEIHISL